MLGEGPLSSGDLLDWFRGLAQAPGRRREEGQLSVRREGQRGKDRDKWNCFINFWNDYRGVLMKMWPQSKLLELRIFSCL